MSKRLLVTSDDFGMCHAVNTGIFRAMTEGVVRSTNFMVPCPWFNEALAMAQAHSLSAGVHLVLTCDWDHLKWTPLTRAESLIDENGHFHTSYAALAGRAKESEIYDELRAQIERVRAGGYTPTHLDSHMLGSTDDSDVGRWVREITIRIAQDQGLIYTYERVDGRLKHFVDEAEISLRSRDEIVRTLESWKDDGVYHLIGHAAEPSPELFAMCSPGWPARAWAAPARVQDLSFFLDPATARWFEELGFEQVGLSDLARL